MLQPIFLALALLPPGPLGVDAEESGPVRLWIPRTATPTRHPAFVFAGGLQSNASVNAGLCVWLASHGYVTAAFATQAPPRFDAASVDIQLGEVESLVAMLRQRKDVDPRRVALGAWSFGGVTTALAAMKDRRIAALVSLDAATGYDYGHGLLTRHAGFAPERTAKLPFLHIADSFEKRAVAKDFRYAEQLHRGPVWLGEMPALKHGEFISADGNGAPDYAELCERVRLFLDAHVRGNRRSAGELARRSWRRAGQRR